MTISNWREISEYSFLHVYAENKIITLDELHLLEKLALEDGQVDEHEKHVLRNIFNRADTAHMDEDTIVEMEAFRKHYEI